MDRFDRIYALHKQLARARRGRSVQQLADALECDQSTAKRIIRAMRDYLNAPIVYDRDLRAYRYDETAAGGTYELPGLWFTGDELLALFTSHQLLSAIQPGLLETELAPLKKRIEQLLDHRQQARGKLTDRLRLIRAQARPVAPVVFRTIASCLAQGRRLQFTYHARGTDTRTTRTVSPQRLVHYRDNWYLDAWDHGRSGLRTFALDRISEPIATHQARETLDDAILDAHLSSSYGIFSGAPDASAILRFSPERARWVADETWHPAQTSRWLDDGRFELTIPYHETPELVMDILKHGAEVEVIAPTQLRNAVAAELTRALSHYT